MLEYEVMGRYEVMHRAPNTGCVLRIDTSRPEGPKRTRVCRLVTVWHPRPMPERTRTLRLLGGKQIRSFPSNARALDTRA